MGKKTNEAPELSALIEKVEKAKREGSVDLSLDEDLSVGVMNLISLEEHFFFTGVKTEKPEYFELLNEVRAMRKRLLERLVPKGQHEGETWCIMKHLLGTTMRLMEVGTKLQASGKPHDAAELFGHAHKAYSLFWGLRLKLFDFKGLKKVSNYDAADPGKPWTVKDIVDKLVNCCDE